MNQATDPRIPGHRFLHSPGPTHIPEAVQNAMRSQPMDLGDARVDRLIADCEAGLKRLLNSGSADVFLYACNGHGAWEAVIANLLAPGKTVLVPGTGHFSESWALQSEGLGAQVLRTPYREGHTMDLDAVEQALRDDRSHDIVALFAVHTDTASATTHDLLALRRLLDAIGHPALLVVDVVASLAAAPFDMQAIGANVVVGASQKGLMVGPGLAFCAVDARAFELAQRNPNPRFYWDWRSRKSDLAYRKFCGTPPHNLLAGLRAALALIDQEGLAQVLARHQLLAEATQAAVQTWQCDGGLDFLCREPAARSVSVTAVLTPPGLNPDQLRQIAREQFQVAIAGGLGPFAGRVFRIGHLGDLNPAMLLGCLAGVEAALRVLEVPLGGSGVASAVERLARAGWRT